MDIESGNAGDVFTAGTGWIVGYSDWTQSAPANMRHVPREEALRGLAVKWMFHPAGDTRGSNPPKPISEGRSMNVMVSDRGVLRLHFSKLSNFPPEHTVERVLRRHGDFCVWGAGLYHRAYFDEDCTILTLRWTHEGAA
jgi:hypothetical protein